MGEGIVKRGRARGGVNEGFHEWSEGEREGGDYDSRAALWGNDVLIEVEGTTGRNASPLPSRLKRKPRRFWGALMKPLFTLCMEVAVVRVNGGGSDGYLMTRGLQVALNHR